MIRIKKPKCPAVLATHGPSKVAELVDEISRGAAKLRFDASIYAHYDVKKALRVAQHDKCAFCESKIMHIGFGDVEHFRPKGGVRQDEDEVLQFPGYYWLSYEWNNLFISCQLCNQRFKGNMFPLRNPGCRARSARHGISGETPLLINPGSDYPEKHLTFDGETVVPRSGSPKGQITIKVLGLNRSELLEHRLRMLRQLRHMRETVSILTRFAKMKPSEKVRSFIRKIKEDMAAAIADDAEYAAMARVTLA